MGDAAPQKRIERETRVGYQSSPQNDLELDWMTDFCNFYICKDEAGG